MGRKQTITEPPDERLEWLGEDLCDIGETIRLRDAKLFAKCLRESCGIDREVMQIIADLLDPPTKDQLHLQFARKRRRGRPPCKKKPSKYPSLRLRVFLKHRKSQSKFENDVFDAAIEAMVSRATVFRALACRKL